MGTPIFDLEYNKNILLKCLISKIKQSVIVSYLKKNTNIFYTPIQKLDRKKRVLLNKVMFLNIIIAIIVL